MYARVGAIYATRERGRESRKAGRICRGNTSLSRAGPREKGARARA